MKTNMTHHAKNDRMARLEYIVDTVGVGKVIATSIELDKYNRETISELTTTGVIIIRNTERMVVTAYIAEMNQAIKVWRTAKGTQKMPTPVYNKIRQNYIVRINQPC